MVSSLFCFLWGFFYYFLFMVDGERERLICVVEKYLRPWVREEEVLGEVEDPFHPKKNA